MLRIILVSLRKRAKKFALVFVQFFIGLTVLLFGMFSVERFFRYERNVEQVLPVDMLHLMGTAWCMRSLTLTELLWRWKIRTPR